MSREDAARIKAALDDAYGLCDALGLLEGKHGRDWHRRAGGVMFRCPWHDEKTPSCSATRDSDGTIQAFCFGCKATGDAFSLIGVTQGLDPFTDFLRIVDLAADLAGLPRPERGGDRQPTTAAIVRKPAPVRHDAPEDGIIDRIAEVLARVAPVTRMPEAMAYLRERGLSRSPAEGWYAVPDGKARADVVSAILEAVGYDAWMASGLSAIKGRRIGQWSYAWTGPRLVIPWRAPNGTAETLQGRFLGDAPEDVRKYVFPRERRPRWPFGCDAFGESAGPDTAVAWVEGAVDGVSFDLLARLHDADALALALPGVAAWDDRWLRLAARRPNIVGLDRPKEGPKGDPVRHADEELVLRLRAVARRGADRLPMVTVRKPATGKDWNDVWRAILAKGQAA